jgi:hypothetical protein
MIAFKRIAYDTVQVGEELESTDLVVKPEDVDTSPTRWTTIIGGTSRTRPSAAR